MISDPIESIVATALDAAGIAYDHDIDPRPSRCACFRSYDRASGSRGHGIGARHLRHILQHLNL